ncbi:METALLOPROTEASE M41 FTSH [Salix viminalis]|uniref:METALLOPROTEASE M41 FTSH n=1 Tax=Salix viminalis TaxID=40686 RepID=A0A9Q0QJF1_SALVM|nr:METALLOPROTEASE M41 FTSH [Salix viminalis]
MDSFSSVCNNGFLNFKLNSRVNDGNTKSLKRYSTICYSPVLIPSLGLCSASKLQHLLLWRSNVRSSFYDGKNGVHLLGFCGGCKSQNGLSCKSSIRQLRSGNGGDEESQLRKRGNGNFRKRFSFRLKTRLRLLKIRLKGVSIRSMFNDFGMFLRRNIKRMTLYTSISVALGMCYLFLRLTALPSPRIVPYSELIASLQNGYVTKVLLEEGSRRIYYNTDSLGTENTENSEDKSSVVDFPNENAAETVAIEGVVSKTGLASRLNVFKKFSRPRASIPEWQFSTRKVDRDEKFLLTLMRAKGTAYSSAPQSILMSIRSLLITIISLWIPLTPMMWLLYRQLSAANSPARKRRSNNQAVNFDDVEGVDIAKIELMEIVLCLQGAMNYQKLGAKLPRGVLLVGPPGTGKTLLARAVAGEAGVPFFSLLTEMDGFESDMKVVVIAATNRPEALDPALCRPGRFSRKVVVGEPDEEGRRKILAVHLRGVPLDEDSDLICNLVASLTPGFVGADLANIINEAALLAARRGGDVVTREDVMEAIERAKFGIRDRQLRPSTISKKLGKLFPWIPSLTGRIDTRQDDLQGPLGYQTLS